MTSRLLTRQGQIYIAMNFFFCWSQRFSVSLSFFKVVCYFGSWDFHCLFLPHDF